MGGEKREGDQKKGREKDGRKRKGEETCFVALFRLGSLLLCQGPFIYYYFIYNWHLKYVVAIFSHGKLALLNIKMIKIIISKLFFQKNVIYHFRAAIDGSTNRE